MHCVCSTQRQRCAPVAWCRCATCTNPPTLHRLRHRHFLKAAVQRKAVKQAFRFVQVLPRQYVDTRTYNMLVSVCVAASDLKAAMAAADMLVSTGALVVLGTCIAGWLPAPGNPQPASTRDIVLLHHQCCTCMLHAPSPPFTPSPPSSPSPPSPPCTPSPPFLAAGCKLDTRLYTNLIAACSRVGAVEQAFQLYADMKVEKVKVGTTHRECACRCE